MFLIAFKIFIKFNAVEFIFCIAAGQTFAFMPNMCLPEGNFADYQNI